MSVPDYATCKVCGKGVDLNSVMQSRAANWTQVHQTPCLHVFMIARADFNGEYLEIPEILEELLQFAELECLTQPNVCIPYYTYLVALFFDLRRRKDVLKELEGLYHEGHKANDTIIEEHSAGIEVPTTSSQDDTKPA